MPNTSPPIKQNPDTIINNIPITTEIPGWLSLTWIKYLLWSTSGAGIRSIIRLSRPEMPEPSTRSRVYRPAGARNRKSSILAVLKPLTFGLKIDGISLISDPVDLSVI